jgi:hypothetical protein
VSVNDQIETWLDEIGLAQYATVFAENAIDLDVLPDMTETDLERLGVALGDRKRILRAIAALSRARPAAAAPATVLSGTVRSQGIFRAGGGEEVAQIGTAIGREFTYRLLAAVAPIFDPSDNLLTLADEVIE